MDNVITVGTLSVLDLLLGLVAFLAIFVLNSMINRLSSVESGQKSLSTQIASHREDLLKNYVRQEHIRPMRNEMVESLQRLEEHFLRALSEQERRYTSQLEILRSSISRNRSSDYGQGPPHLQD